jgi:exopolysaccharide production protein ExoZ
MPASRGGNRTFTPLCDAPPLSELRKDRSVINNIQCLRGIAALMVVVFHIVLVSRAYGHPAGLFEPLYPWGQSGVDLFFVISGFIMVHIQTLRPKGAGAFFAGRVARIAPLYLLMTAVVMAALIAVPEMMHQMRISASWVACSLTFSCLHTGHVEPLLYVGWTLEYEMAFYAIFALAILMSSPARRDAWVIAAITLLWLVGGYRPIVFEFAFGMLAAHAVQRLAGNPAWSRIAPLMLAAGVAAFAAPIFVSTGFGREITFGLPAILIVVAAALLPQTANEMMIRLGDASYSLYLVQVFTIPVHYRIVTALFPGMNADLSGVLCLASTVAGGFALHLIVERNILPLGRALAGRRAAIPA